MAVKNKLRLDQILIDRGFAETAVIAQSLVMTGKVFSGHKRLDKPGMLFAGDIALEIKTGEHPWVSRGGMKLDHAIRHFGIPAQGRLCLDIGASTGGFTDVLLHYGAGKIYAIDVGYGQLAWKLQKNPRVVVLDRTNARHLNAGLIPDKIDLITCDASFIGLKTVLPAALKLAAEGCRLAALIKPQFEVSKEEVGEGGIIRDEKLHARVCGEINDWLGTQAGWRVLGITESPIRGMEGNKEFLIAGIYHE